MAHYWIQYNKNGKSRNLDANMVGIDVRFDAVACGVVG